MNAHWGLDDVHANFSSIDPVTLFPLEVAARGSFDVLFLSQVFEHVLNPGRFLANGWASLRPGGMICIDAPNDRGLTAFIRRLNRWDGAYGEIVPPDHMIAFNAKTLEFALKMTGYENVSTFTAAHNHPTYGLAHPHIHKSRKLQMMRSLSDFMGLGGSLVVMAQRPLGDGRAALC